MEGRTQGQAFASLAPGQAMDVGETALPPWVSRMTGRIALQPTRPVPRGKRLGSPQVDLRKTLRRWARLGGQGLAPVLARRPRRPGKLSILWDVSGSMADCTELYLPWLWKLARLQPDVRVHAFGTRLIDITTWLHLPYRTCRARLGLETAVWKSGTDIGSALQTWLRDVGDRQLGGSSTVIIISDGWDAGEPDQLRDALRQLRSRCAALLWLHPWFATPGFAPETRALRTAMPYLDALVDGGSPEALCSLAAPRGMYRAGM
ncbi:MAG: VWA domain-containing protein [Thermoflavifilum sp.]|nr:VWA domain-containing protein [Thermoflavifilum sp.]MCL6512795.1 VWA domain-containing protein [Alicyclobacillus sp.]